LYFFDIKYEVCNTKDEKNGNRIMFLCSKDPLPIQKCMTELDFEKIGKKNHCTKCTVYLFISIVPVSTYLSSYRLHILPFPGLEINDILFYIFLFSAELFRPLRWQSQDSLNSLCLLTTRPLFYLLSSAPP
jgi:hypothetical protein